MHLPKVYFVKNAKQNHFKIISITQNTFTILTDQRLETPAEKKMPLHQNPSSPNYKYHYHLLDRCSNWEKLNRGVQTNELKTEFQVHNNTKHRDLPTTAPTTPRQFHLYFEYHFSATQIFKYWKSNTAGI